MILSYIAGYSKFDGSSDFDQDGGAHVPTSFATGATFQDDRTNYSHYKNYSHELDLKSIGDNAIDWILGLYYAAEDNSHPLRHPDLQRHAARHRGLAGLVHPAQGNRQIRTPSSARQRGTSATRCTSPAARATRTTERKRSAEAVGAGRTTRTCRSCRSTPGTIPGPDTGFGFGVGGINDGHYSANKPTWLVRLDADLADDVFCLRQRVDRLQVGRPAGRRRALQGRDADELRSRHRSSPSSIII